ncbi:MAG: hypothetical protein JWM43_3658 [Acidobacteriaceae bacterium]|nr:hypothetical protein [Acidobacteriaceae bacterium]
MVSSRAAGLKRIAELYSVVEEVRGVAVQRATSALAATESVLADLRTARLGAHAEGRRSLAEGDRLERMIAEGRSRIIVREQESMEGQRIVQKRLLDGALEVYRISRIEKDQMAKLLENSQRQEEVLETRRTQAIADDRFLSRRAWKHGSAHARPRMSSF